MIKLCDNYEDHLIICDKLKEVKKNINLKANTLYGYMQSINTYTYISEDDGIMNGCLVLLLANNIFQEQVLSLLFTWIDPHYPDLHKEFIQIAIDKAKTLKVKKVIFITNRDEKVINRKMGKYGFKKICSSYEKEVLL